MSLFLIGIDHKSAPIGIREGVYWAQEEIESFLKAGSLRGTALFATCNRIEIYGEAADNAELEKETGLFLRVFSVFSRSGYIKNGRREISRHVVRLAAGLESRLKGELQILGQIDAWRKNAVLPPHISGIFEEAVQAARRIREKSGLDYAGANIAVMTLEDILRNAGHGRRIELAVVGTGKVAELFALYNRPEVSITFFANKNYNKAERLAAASGGKALRFRNLATALKKTDAVVSATSSPHFVVRRKEIAEAASDRSRPLYIYDLAFPRDVDPDVEELPAVILKNSENLSSVFEEYNSRISGKIVLAEYLVEEALNRSRGHLNVPYHCG